jgi:RNA polymerase sigma-70 factor (ECF subfamily)
MPSAAPDLDQHRDYLYAYALRRMGDSGLAEDLVQDTFVAALGAARGFRGDSSVRTWLTGILKRRIADSYRAPERGVESLDANAEQAPEIPAPDADPALGFEQVRLWEALQKQLDRLPARAAKAFVLSELEGRDADEVSRILGITPNNVWGMVRRARKSLQESMAPVLSAAI